MHGVEYAGWGTLGRREQLDDSGIIRRYIAWRSAASRGGWGVRDNTARPLRTHHRRGRSTASRTRQMVRYGSSSPHRTAAEAAPGWDGDRRDVRAFHSAARQGCGAGDTARRSPDQRRRAAALERQVGRRRLRPGRRAASARWRGQRSLVLRARAKRRLGPATASKRGKDLRYDWRTTAAEPVRLVWCGDRPGRRQRGDVGVLDAC